MLGDRAQAPSGAGFALENRVATSRVFADLYAETHVHRLAGFFRGFRDALQGLSAEPDARPAILTPGPLNDTYYEHACIARYLGFTLLEGEDLTVEHGRLMVRTVAGLRPVCVLWRRLDAAFADPLELDATSRLGTPGLVGALRQGSVTLVNALGSGILETRALLAFMPRIAEALLGEDAHPAQHRHLVVRPARRARARPRPQGPDDDRPRALDPPPLRGRRHHRPRRPRSATRRGAASTPGSSRDGADLVGQEAVMLSTTPAYVDGALVPRPMSLRVFLARTPRGLGGHARRLRPRSATRPTPAPSPCSAAAPPPTSGWSSPRPVETVTMLPTDGHALRPRPPRRACRAAPATTSSGSAATSSAPRARCGSLRAYHVRLAETADPERRCIADFARLSRRPRHRPGEGVPAALTAHARLAPSSAPATSATASRSTAGWR